MMVFALEQAWSMSGIAILEMSYQPPRIKVDDSRSQHLLLKTKFYLFSFHLLLFIPLETNSEGVKFVVEDVVVIPNC